MTIQESNDIQLDELAIARARLEEKDQQIQALKMRVEVLEDLLNRFSQRAPQSQPQRSLKPAPRRWGVR